MTYNSGLVLLTGWLDGSVRSYAFMMGYESIKNFVKTAATAVIGYGTEIAANYNLTIEGSNFIEVTNSVAKTELAMGWFQEDHVTITGDDTENTLILRGCPYALICSGLHSDMNDMELPASTKPCYRTELYVAANTLILGSAKSRYVVKEADHGKECKVEVEWV
jgi:hypothetical protein